VFLLVDSVIGDNILLRFLLIHVFLGACVEELLSILYIISLVACVRPSEGVPTR
jgi:hypothetical protein